MRATVRRMKYGVWLGVLLLAFGCGDDDGGTDAGGDSAMMDSGGDDAGGDDAGGDDAGGDDAGGDDAGDDDAGGDDAGADDAGATCPDLMPVGARELVISQIDIDGSQVELYNPGDEDVLLGEHVFCSRPSYQDVAGLGPSTIPARGYALYTLPPSFQLVAGGAGELALYSERSYRSGDAMLDFVCFDGDRATSRKSVAEGAGLWSGECGAAGSGAIMRTVSTAGTSSGDYEVAGEFLATSCE